MDTLSAFAMRQANRGRECKVFDWDKAARLIAESGARHAEAGLSEDWWWTGGDILADGLPVSERVCVYLASTWATPVLVLDGDEVECWRMQSETPDWDADTWWPDSAKALLTEPQS